MTQIVLVDENDRVLGFKEKFAAHRITSCKIPVALHRAISIVIFNKDKSEMLITKRSIYKPTWPYFWSNAVCSHPYPKETYQKAAERRLYEELSFRTPLKEVAGYEWIGIKELKKDLKINPKKYTPWFQIILEKLGS